LSLVKISNTKSALLRIKAYKHILNLEKMHFASRTEINTPLAKQIQCFEFAIEYFPKAFMNIPT
jgi:hypothetical protein